jgi:4-amino-4-deoxy-L-arabinose transferase-like glycosyltransferase
MNKLLKKINLHNKKLITAILLCLILVFSFVIRIYDLNSIPLGFHIDEASLGYNGYSLLLTGKDDNYDKFPLYIDMFGDNRPSGYHYLTELPIKFLGLNEFSTRLPGALSGALLVIPFFFLAQILFKSKKISLLSSFLIAFAPWSVVLSRASNETIVSLLLILSGYVLLLYGFWEKRIKYFFISIIFLSLSFFFYHTPRIFVPLLILVTILYLFPIWKNFVTKQKVSLLLSFIVLSLISFSLVFLIKGGTGRFSQVNIFGYPQVRLLQEEQIREDGVEKTPVILTRFFHNKPLNYSLAFLSNYSEYFTGKFLFLEGGLPIWYRVPAMGLIYLIELPFILYGIFLLLKSKNKYHKLPLIWLILAPVTAAITRDDIPNINRAVIMFPMIELMAAYGFAAILNKFSGFKYKILIGIVSLFFLLNFSYFLHQYFIHSQINKNWYRNEGFGDMVKLVKKDYANVDKVIVTKSLGGIYPLILFYMQYNPSTYQSEGSPKDKMDSGFGKFYFALAACPSIDRDPKFPKSNKTIYVDNGTCPDYKGLENTKHTYITRKDGTRVFRIVYE